MRLYELAKVIRSKNAGPFTLTIDILFEKESDFDRLLQSESFRPERIAALYSCSPDKIAIRPFRRVLAVKVVMPRPVSSGAPGDLDVYGSQQHFPLAGMQIA